MPKKVKIILAAVLAISILLMTFGAGCILGSSAADKPNFNLINQAWDIIHRNFVSRDQIDPEALNHGAIRGMVQALDDRYTYFLTPSEYELTQGNFQSSFGGIGASISLNDDDQPVIVNILKDTPAERSGLMSGDIILRVGETYTTDMSVQQVVTIVRGPIGTPVKLTVLRESQEDPIEIDIIREEINPSTVEYRMEGDIAYIQISNFYENTNDELQAALEALDLANARGIIIDLRNNLGGYVNVLVDVASHFIKEGTIIITQDNEGRRTSYSVNPNGTFTDLPMVVLVNEFSASASEVFSGAMQDYQRATIAGAVTFGKGSYDAFYNLSDGSAIYLTIGRWLTPNGREIEEIGITPDHTLPESEDEEEAIRWAVDYLHNLQP